jgi:hypothetical protein
MVVTMRAEIIALLQVVDGAIAPNHECHQAMKPAAISDLLHTARDGARWCGLLAARRSQREFSTRGVGCLGA